MLALRGYFPVAELRTFDAIDSRLQGHPDMTPLPGLDMSTGSLGQGLSPGVGMALAAKLRGQGYRTWVMLGDGEIQEGQIWEACFTAARYQLDNLTAILDSNSLPQFGWPSPAGSPATGRRRSPGQVRRPSAGTSSSATGTTMRDHRARLCRGRSPTPVGRPA